ncbi:MAG: CdaR family protein [Bacteroides sp.]|nr:CdaR family protein [Prevotella sp.]MCM1407345.1 CdaR family protein [Treponema brennaborense]MCM1469835.1 CdaR family protein [Bacteroides sp.]
MKSELKNNVLFENWPVKVTCFVLALILYLFYSMSTLDVRHIAVPLVVQGDRAVAVMSDVPRYVKVTLRGRAENIAQIPESDISAFLNMKYYLTPGTYDIPVSVQLTGASGLVTPLEFSVSPQKISLTLEERITSYVPVKPEFVGNPAHGYVLAASAVSPQYVRISGSKSAVENTKSIATEPVILDNADRNATVNVRLLNTVDLVSVESENFVSLSYEIQQNIITREFSGNSIYFARMPDGMQVSSPQTSFKLTLSGPQLVLESYVLADGAVRADCSRISAPCEYELPLEVFLPSDIKLKNLSPQTISVRAAVSRSEQTENSDASANL